MLEKGAICAVFILRRLHEEYLTYNNNNNNGYF